MWLRETDDRQTETLMNLDYGNPFRRVGDDRIYVLVENPVGYGWWAVCARSWKLEEMDGTETIELVGELEVIR